MKFTPYPDKYLVKPLKKHREIEVDEPVSIGEVIYVGPETSKFCKKGDILYFRPHGCWHTEVVDDDDEIFWVVPDLPEFILGKRGK